MSDLNLDDQGVTSSRLSASMELSELETLNHDLPYQIINSKKTSKAPNTANDDHAKNSLSSQSSGPHAGSCAHLDEPEKQSDSTESSDDISEFDINLSLSQSSPNTGWLVSGENMDRFGLEFNKSLTLFDGLALVIGLIIGSGIFASPGQVHANVGSPGAAIIIWSLSGVLAWTGAASFAELGSIMPRNGGAQIYLSTIYGDWLSFLYSWTAVFILKPGSAAIIAVIFADYAEKAVSGYNQSGNTIVRNVIAIACLFIVTGLNCLSTRLTTRVSKILMVLKFVALLSVGVAGLVYFSTSKSRQTLKFANNWFQGTSTDVSDWAIALCAGLWAFDGWDNVNLVAGEFINPTRDLPLVLHLALPSVTLAYIIASLSYYLVLPLDVIEKSRTIAVTFGQTVLGSPGAIILALIVAASCLGALNATIFTSGRLAHSAASEGHLPQILTRVGLRSNSQDPSPLTTVNASSSHNNSSRTNSRPKNRPRVRLNYAALHLSPSRSQLVGEDGGPNGLFFTPVNAMIFNAVLASVFLCFSELSGLLSFYAIASYSFYFLTVLGVIILRVREPNLDRSYRTWVSTPIIFCCASLLVLSRAVVAGPIIFIIVMSSVITSVIFYVWRFSPDAPATVLKSIYTRISRLKNLIYRL